MTPPKPIAAYYMLVFESFADADEALRYARSGTASRAGEGELDGAWLLYIPFYDDLSELEHALDHEREDD